MIHAWSGSIHAAFWHAIVGRRIRIAAWLSWLSDIYRALTLEPQGVIPAKAGIHLAVDSQHGFPLSWE